MKIIKTDKNRKTVSPPSSSAPIPSGPVLAAWLAVDWLVRGLVHHYYGTPAPKRQFVKAKLAETMKKPPFMEFRMRVQLTATPEGYVAAPIPREVGMAAMARMNGLVTIPIGETGFAAGELVDVELLVGEELIPCGSVLP